MKKIIFALCVSFFCSGSLYAKSGYGAAGCGLGALIFGSKPGFVQVIAATFNGTFANQTFGITSGTSNCATKTKKSAAAKVFIEANKIAVQNDSARGQGEAIDSLLDIYGCESSSKVHIQSNYKMIFSNSEASAIEAAMSDVLRSNNCKV